MERARRIRAFLWAWAIGLTLYVLIAHPAVAADGFSLFDPIEEDARNQSNSWFNTIVGMVRPTFLILATLEICWAAAIWAFEKDNLNSLAIEIIKKIMFIGFFFALLQFAPDWIPTITDTFQRVGEQTVGTPPLTTDGIIATGMQVIGQMWASTAASAAPFLATPTEFAGATIPFTNDIVQLGWWKVAMTAIATVGLVIAYVIVAAQFFTLKIESYILFAAGAIFLGLGSSSWTKEYVTKYLNYAINVGVRLLVLILILSLTLHAVSQMGSEFSFDFTPPLKVLAAAALQAILAIKAPEMAGALLSGGVGFSAGSAVGAAKSASGMAMGGVGAAAGAAQGVGNLSKAVSAGRQLAQQEGKSGAGAVLSGLSAATREAGRALPGKLMDAIKGKGQGGGQGGLGGGRGQNPGVFDLAKRNLQARVAGGGGGGGAGGGVGGGGGGPSTGAMGLSAAALSNTPSGSGSSGGGGTPAAGAPSASATSHDSSSGSGSSSGFESSTGDSEGMRPPPYSESPSSHSSEDLPPPYTEISSAPRSEDLPPAYSAVASSSPASSGHASPTAGTPPAGGRLPPRPMGVDRLKKASRPLSQTSGSRPLPEPPKST